MQSKTTEEETRLAEMLPNEVKYGLQLEYSRRDRRHWEGEWMSNEASLFDIGAEGGVLRADVKLETTTTDEADIGSTGDVTDNFMGINLSARNMQLIFSQLTSNTPVVMAIPQSNEQQDINAAKSAEVVMSYARKQYYIDNKIALAVYNTFVYGTGFFKQIYDATLGAYLIASPDGKKFKPTGDHKLTAPRPWDIYIDPNAKTQDEIKWICERMYVDVDEALTFFGEEFREILLAYKIDTSAAPTPYGGEVSLFYDIRHDCVEVFERWETGLPENGYKGRLVYHLRDGRVLKMQDSPCSHAIYPDSAERKSMKARLPYSILSYEDTPNSIWGRSPAGKAGRVQAVLNAVSMIMLQTAQNMGTPTFVVNKNSVGDSAQDLKTNNPINMLMIDLSGESGGTMPFHLQGASTSQDTKLIYENCVNYINDAWGVNDALLGKQSRETQGVTMQLSIMQGNTIRERLFAKYVYFVEDIYNLLLADVAKYWKLERIVKAVGSNNKVNAEALSGAMVASGFIVKVERNSVFALDPITRQEQLLNLRGVFLEAGMDPRCILKLLQVADLRGAYEEFDLADNRAQKILKNIKDKKKVLIGKYEDHIGIFGFLKRYVMTEEHDLLDEDIKMVIEKHMDERMKMESKNRLPAQNIAPPPPAGGAAPFSQAPAPPQIGPA